MLLFNYKSFIESSISLNSRGKIYFGGSLKNLSNFLNYISNVAKSKDFISNFDFIENLYELLVSNNKKEIKYLANNLKMSTLEILI